jgi:hypothetical protein
LILRMSTGFEYRCKILVSKFDDIGGLCRIFPLVYQAVYHIESIVWHETEFKASNLK